jgi:hypothetical protein
MADGYHTSSFLLHLGSSSLLRCRRLLKRPSMTVMIMKPMAILVELIIKALVFQDLVHLVGYSLAAKLNYLRRQKSPFKCISRQLIELLYSTSKV